MDLRSCAPLVLACFVLACGDDSGSNADTDAADTGSSTSNADTAGTGGDDGLTSTDGSGGDDVGDTSGGMSCDNTDQMLIDMCIEAAEAEMTCEEVATCNCSNCACELQACQMDADCTAIRECAQATGCNGIDCLDPTTCGDVIDAAGGPTGTGATLALQLSTCNQGAMCPITCDGDTGDTGDTGDSTGDTGATGDTGDTGGSGSTG